MAKACNTVRTASNSAGNRDETSFCNPFFESMKKNITPASEKARASTKLKYTEHLLFETNFTEPEIYERITGKKSNTAKINSKVYDISVAKTKTLPEVSAENIFISTVDPFMKYLHIEVE